MSEGVQGHANSCASSKLEDRRGTIRALGRTQRLLLWLTSVPADSCDSPKGASPLFPPRIRGIGPVLKSFEYKALVLRHKALHAVMAAKMRRPSYHVA
eukprot:1160114-Pelagomonas_calceolata.AAC.2